MFARIHRWCGWNPLILPVLAASITFAAYGVFEAYLASTYVPTLSVAVGAALMACAVAITVTGVRRINREYDAFGIPALEQIANDGVSRLGSRFRREHMHWVLDGSGRSWFIHGPAMGLPALLFTEEHALGVCQGAAIDFKRQQVSLSEVVREIPYEEIVGLTTMKYGVIVNLRSAPRLLLASHKFPEQALDILRQRIDAARRGEPTSSAPPGVQREVIERQILVVRCAHCSELTPADQHRCKHCGAAVP